MILQIKQTLKLSCLGLILTLGAQNEVFAQKYKFNQRNNTVKLPASTKKDVYRIDILLPINIDSLYSSGSLTTNQQALNSIQPYIYFYQGVQLATKKLEHDKQPLDIYIHEEKNEKWDLSYYNTTKGLQNSDLIIGLLSSKDLKNAADYAEQYKINFISAFSPADAGVRDNPYFHLLQPTLISNIEELVKFSMVKFPKEKKFIMFSNDDREKDMHDQIKSTLNNDKRIVSFDLSYTQLDTKVLTKVFDADQTNIIYVPILNTQTANNILNALSKLPEHYEFEIFGCPTWRGIQNEQIKSKSNISFYYTEAFNFDLNTGIAQDLKNNYNRIYSGAPNEMVYRGYETVIWYFDLLTKYGNVFNDKYSDATAAPFTRYKVEPVFDDDGFKYYENKNVSIYRMNLGTKELMNP